MTKARFLAESVCLSAVLIIFTLMHNAIISSLYDYTVWARLIPLLSFSIYSKNHAIAIDITIILETLLLLIDVIYWLVYALPSGMTSIMIVVFIIVILQYIALNTTLKLKDAHANDDSLHLPSTFQIRCISVPFGLATLLTVFYTNISPFSYALRLMLQLDGVIAHYTIVGDKNTHIIIIERITLLVDIYCIVNTFITVPESEYLYIAIDATLQLFLVQLVRTLSVTVLALCVPNYISVLF
mgnify:CR=1 FL=1